METNKRKKTMIKNGTIAKSGVYSTSNTNHYNKIDSNIIKGYKYGVHLYALETCRK